MLIKLNCIKKKHLISTPSEKHSIINEENRDTFTNIFLIFLFFNIDSIKLLKKSRKVNLKGRKKEQKQPNEELTA